MHSIEDEDFISVTEEETPEDSIQLPSHDASLTPTDMVRVMRQAFHGIGSFTPLGHIQTQPSFYETDHAFIFPPSSDDESAQMLPHIASTLARNAQDKKNTDDLLLNHSQLKSKLWLFPVAEELVCGRPILNLAKPLMARNHWVTLCYDPTNETATVLDSRPFYSTATYSIRPMIDLLSTGLRHYGLNVKASSSPISQGIQPDNIHCGRWTLINLILLAQGSSLEDIQRDLRGEDFPYILPYLDSLARGEKPGPYVMQAYGKQASDTAPSSRSDSTESLTQINASHYDDAIDAFIGQNLQKCIQIARESFQRYFADTATKLEFFVAERSIYQDGQLLRLVNDEAHLIRILNELEEKYSKVPRDLLRTQIDLPISPTGYSLKDPSRLRTWLAHIGIPHREIDTLSISQLVLLNQALICARQTYYEAFAIARANFIGTIEEQVCPLVEGELEKKIKEKHFDALIHMILRDEIKEKLASHIKATSNASADDIIVSAGTLSAAAKEDSPNNEGTQHIDLSMTINRLLTPFLVQAKRMFPSINHRYTIFTFRQIVSQRDMIEPSIPRYRFTALDRAFWHQVWRYQHSMLTQSRRLISNREEHPVVSFERQRLPALPETQTFQGNSQDAENDALSMSVRIDASTTDETHFDLQDLDEEFLDSFPHGASMNLSGRSNDADTDIESNHSLYSIPLYDDSSHSRVSRHSTSQIRIIHCKPQQPFYQNPHFQLRCLQALFAISLALAALTILLSPLAASAVGLALGASLATGVMAASASLSGITLASSCYGFYARRKNIDLTAGMSLDIQAIPA